MRFTQEVNIQLFGDRSVAVQYIGLARKLLGNLTTYNHDLSPITREGITSRTHKTPDGALIQVIWFPWQPVIKIFPPGWNAIRGERQRCAFDLPAHHLAFDGNLSDTGTVGGWDHEVVTGWWVNNATPITYKQGVVGQAVNLAAYNGQHIVHPDAWGTFYYPYEEATLSVWFNLEWVLDDVESGFVNIINPLYDEVYGSIFTYKAVYVYMTRGQTEYEGADTLVIQTEGIQDIGDAFQEFYPRPMQYGQWQHLVITVDPSGLNAYLGGQLVQTVGYSGFRLPAYDISFSYPGGGFAQQPWDDPIRQPYSCLIDDCAVWTKVLTPTQIKQLAAGTPASELCV